MQRPGSDHRAGHWVVVGAGSAGCVVARRLVDAGAEVTLLETGPALEPGSVPPTIEADNAFGALTDDRIHVDLTATRTSQQAPTRYLRGRGVGGSSAVNAMVALRGDRELYRSWGWDDVDDAWARVLVPAHRPATAELGPVDRALLAATSDASVVPLTRVGGRRVTSAEAYLWDLHGHPGLRVRPNTTVDRVSVGPGGRVDGVVLATGERIDAGAVVISAGAIHSPAILLRSELGLPGVGDGLQDHPAAAFALTLREPPTVRPDSGLLGLATTVAVERDPIQILAMNHLGTTAPIGLLLVSLMRPRSASGTVRLRTSDPLVDPIVDFDLLSDRADVTRLRDGVSTALDLLDSQPFRDLVESVSIDDAGTAASALVDDAAIDDWLRRRSADYVHATSTCAMGRVVDDAGRVPSVAGLRVCDASVFPSIPDVNTHLPTTMLAERLVARWIGEMRG